MDGRRRGRRGGDDAEREKRRLEDQAREQKRIEKSRQDRQKREEAKAGVTARAALRAGRLVQRGVGEGGAELAVQLELIDGEFDVQVALEVDLSKDLADGDQYEPVTDEMMLEALVLPIERLCPAASGGHAQSNQALGKQNDRIRALLKAANFERYMGGTMMWTPSLMGGDKPLYLRSTHKPAAGKSGDPRLSRDMLSVLMTYTLRVCGAPTPSWPGTLAFNTTAEWSAEPAGHGVVGWLCPPKQPAAGAVGIDR